MAALATMKLTKVEKKTRTTVDTIMVTPEVMRTWLRPSFQRHIKDNAKVRALSESLRYDGGVWPGVVTLGVFEGKTYMIDGQHRAYAFEVSGLTEGYVDVRYFYCESMAEMGREFVRLNCNLVNMRPDDLLRGMEQSIPAVSMIRAACPYVGYDSIRRGANSPVVSMAFVIRAWRAASADVPSSAAGCGALAAAEAMAAEEAGALTEFLGVASAAWGREQEYQRLWGGLNITICMWLYRRLVVTQYSAKTPRLTNDLFRKCLTSLSADSLYLEWLVGRSLTERDRSPAYSKIKGAFSQRLALELGRKPMLPQPAWAH